MKTLAETLEAVQSHVASGLAVWRYARDHSAEEIRYAQDSTLERAEHLVREMRSRVFHATLVRDLIETSYAGDHSVRRTETVDVEIVFPNRAETANQFCSAGEWRVASPAPILIDQEQRS